MMMKPRIGQRAFKMSKEAKNKIAVIGAGIVGVSAAVHLRKLGEEVLLIDKMGVGEETSYGNAGIIETSYALPYGFPSTARLWNIVRDRDTAARIEPSAFLENIKWVVDFYLQSQEKNRLKNGAALRPLTRIALDEHKALMQGTDAANYLSDYGRAKIYRSEEGFAADALEREVAKQAGIRFAVMNADEFALYEPNLNESAYKRAVVWTGSRRVTNPAAVVKAYANAFLQGGGEFLQADVKTLTPLEDSTWRIDMAGNSINVKSVVMCAGPWSQELLAPLGYRFPLGIKRGYSQHFARVGSANLNHAIVDGDIGYVLAQMNEGMRLITGVDMSALHAPSNPAQIQRCLPFAQELFPMGKPASAIWAGNRPCFADSLPVIGASGSHKGLWFNFGHGHSGFTIGPASGNLLAKLYAGRGTAIDPKPYSPARFGM